MTKIKDTHTDVKCSSMSELKLHFKMSTLASLIIQYYFNIANNNKLKFWVSAWMDNVAPASALSCKSILYKYSLDSGKNLSLRVI